MRYGMSDVLGPVTFANENNEVFLGRDFAQAKPYSETIATEIDAEVKRILEESYVRCEHLLREHSEILAKTAKYLLEHEVMDGEAFKYLCEHNELPPTSGDDTPPEGGIDVTITDDFDFDAGAVNGEVNPA
jgi:cell division protease FtsH